MKRIFTWLFLALFTVTGFAQNDIINKLGTDANSSFNVVKTDDTNLFKLSIDGDHLMQLIDDKAFTINNSAGEAIFELDDEYNFSDIAKLKIGHADDDWLAGNFSNLQLQSTVYTKFHLVHIGNQFNLVAGYRATEGGTKTTPAVVGDDNGMLGMYAYGYTGSVYDFAGGILISTDGTYATQVPSKIKFITRTNDAASKTNMIIKGDGKVGIGTETPTSTLEVDGSVTLAYDSGAAATITLDDTHYTYVCARFAGMAVTLPTAVGITGRIYIIKNIEEGAVTVGGDGGTETIDGSTSISLAQWKYVKVQSTNGAWIIIGQN